MLLDPKNNAPHSYSTNKTSTILNKYIQPTYYFFKCVLNDTDINEIARNKLT